MTQPVQIERGQYACDVPGFEHVWVRFAERGYPHKLRRTWFDLQEHETLAAVLGKVTEWNLPTVDGTPLPLPADRADIGAFDDVEWSVLAWMVRAFHWWFVLDIHVRAAPAVEAQP